VRPLVFVVLLAATVAGRRRACHAAISAAIALVAAVVFVAGAAAAVQPRMLVLQRSDVPSRYEFQPGSSGDVRSVGAPDALARPGLIGGFYATYWRDGKSERTIVSAAYLYRSSAGAKAALAAVDREARHNATRSLRRLRTDLGDDAWIYTDRSRDLGTAVVWRSGRVLAVLDYSSPTGHEKLALALARTQQRRIAAALN
jgi:hypothetical protein